MLKRVVVGGMLCLASFFAQCAQAQISCSRDTGQAEIIVCRESSLMALDNDMSRLYHDLQARLPRDARENLRDSQRGWIRHRNGCSDANCIRRAYNDRIQELNNY